MDLTLKIWRQDSPTDKGRMESYEVSGISQDASFLEMMDVLNEKLLAEGKEPVAFDHDCREGICGMCSMFINGRPHGPDDAVTTCQLHMRKFKDGETITIEPWRAKPFPVIKDLIVDRSALDEIIQAGGYISATTGGVPDANTIPVNSKQAELAMDAAACKNASAMLFVSAKVSQFALLPQGKVEAKERVQNMVAKMDELGFGNCSNTYACEMECPKEIKISNIARMNREFLVAKLT